MAQTGFSVNTRAELPPRWKREKAGVHGMRYAPGFAAVCGVRDGFSARIGASVPGTTTGRCPGFVGRDPLSSQLGQEFHQRRIIAPVPFAPLGAESGKLFPKALRCQRKISFSRA